MKTINRHSDFYIKFNNRKEVELFCEYINRNLPNKFRWNSDDYPPLRMDANYILDELYKYELAFHINPEYILTYNSNDKDCFSIYDIEGIGGNIPQNQDLLTWIPK